MEVGDRNDSKNAAKKRAKKARKASAKAAAAGSCGNKNGSVDKPTGNNVASKCVQSEGHACVAFEWLCARTVFGLDTDGGRGSSDDGGANGGNASATTSTMHGHIVDDTVSVRTEMVSAASSAATAWLEASWRRPPQPAETPAAKARTTTEAFEAQPVNYISVTTSNAAAAVSDAEVSRAKRQKITENDDTSVNTVVAATNEECTDTKVESKRTTKMLLSPALAAVRLNRDARALFTKLCNVAATDAANKGDSLVLTEAVRDDAATVVYEPPPLIVVDYRKPS